MLLTFIYVFPIVPIADIKIASSTSNYSYKKSLTFKQVRDDDQGLYECKAPYVHNGTEAYKIVSLIAHGKLLEYLKLSSQIGTSIITVLFC